VTAKAFDAVPPTVQQGRASQQRCSDMSFLVCLLYVRTISVCGLYTTIAYALRKNGLQHSAGHGGKQQLSEPIHHSGVHATAALASNLDASKAAYTPCCPAFCWLSLAHQSVAMQDIEIAPRNSRGFFLLVHIVGYAFGSCAVAVVGYVVANQSDLGWRLLFAMGTLPAFTVLLVTPWLYETPHRWDPAGLTQPVWFSATCSCATDTCMPCFASRCRTLCVISLLRSLVACVIRPMYSLDKHTVMMFGCCSACKLPAQ
jgi:hypothetical protein